MLAAPFANGRPALTFRARVIGRRSGRSHVTGGVGRAEHRASGAAVAQGRATAHSEFIALLGLVEEMRTAPARHRRALAVEIRLRAERLGLHPPMR